MKHILPILAAWLHDIGKFSQRADAPCSANLDQEYCPGGTSHRHVLYTDYFIEHVLPLPPELEGDRSRLARLAASHHRPDTSSEEEVALQNADWLSSGGDRISGTAEGNYKTARLESVFTNVRLNGKGFDEAERAKRYCLRPIDAANDGCPPIFPMQDGDASLKKHSYGDLYEAFVAELCNPKSVPLHLGIRPYLASLVSLLEKYTWCIPSSTYNSRADISLYDHAATTAAIAQALLACKGSKKALLLAGGEISGIQNFIFGTEGLADKGASKLLRARSLYLQALTRSVWLSLLEELQLTSAAKIMDAGGRFVLLLPDTPEAQEACAVLRKDVELWLLRTFQGAVRMTFATLPLVPADLERTRFRECFEHFNDALETAKLMPFATALREGFSAVLPVDYRAYAVYGECDCCRSRPASGQLDETPVCDMCRMLIEKVGKQLPSAHYLVFTRKAQGVNLFGSLALRLEKNLSNEALFKDASDVVNMRGYDGFSAVPVAGYIPLVTEDELSRWQAEGRVESIDGVDTMGKDPIELNAPKTFAMLAEEARIPDNNGFRSIACLAACKADVDNLGLLFGMGFDGDKGDSLFSISRFAMLSRMMNHFFAAHVPRLMQRDFPNMYLIFAGGDDLFALGPWSETVRFALRLRADFAAFTGGNPAVTFSAGLPVFKPHLPMRAMRLAAEEALETSKHGEKNAATLFGVTADWQNFRLLHEDGQWLEDLCLSGTVTQGFVRRLLSYARDCRDFKAGDIRKGLYLSHMAYDLERNWKRSDEDMKRNGKNETTSDEDLKRICSMGQDKNKFPKAELGISWALYRTRTSR